MVVAALLPEVPMQERLRTAHRLAPLLRAMSTVSIACSSRAFSDVLKAHPGALSVVDPYWSGEFDVEHTKALLGGDLSGAIAYADFRGRPVGVHVPALLEAGARSVVTYDADDAPGQFADLLQQVLGANRLAPVLRMVESRLSWREFLAVRWAILNGTDKTTVEHMAASFQVDPRTVRRWFGSGSRMSARDVVIWGRVLQATLWLEISGEDAKRVALFLGFSSYEDLRRKFRRLTGCNLKGGTAERPFEFAARVFADAMAGTQAAPEVPHPLSECPLHHAQCPILP